MTVLTYHQPQRHNSSRSSGGISLLAPIGTLLTFILTLFYFSDETWLPLDSMLLILAICLVGGLLTTILTSPFSIVLIFCSAFFIRATASIFIYRYLYLYYGFQGFEGNDDVFWDEQAKLLLSGGVSTEQALKEFFSAGYTFLISGVYLIGEPNPLTPRIVNSLVGSLVCVAGYHLANELFHDKRLARRIASLMAFFPVLIYWSAAFQKDILISLFMTTGVYACVKMYKQGFSIAMAVLLLLSVVAELFLRIFAGHLLAITALVALAYRAKRKSLIGGTIGSIVMVVLILGIGSFVVSFSGRSDLTDFQEQYASRAQGFAQSSEKIARGGFADGVSARLTSAPLPVRLVIGPIITLISPVPPGFAWETNFVHSLLSVFQPLQLLLLPYIVAGIYRTLFKTNVRTSGMILLLPAIAVSLVANSFYAVGQITKYRIMIEPLLLLIAVWVYHSSSSNLRIRYFALSALLALSAIGSYIILKYLF